MLFFAPRDGAEHRWKDLPAVEKRVDVVAVDQRRPQQTLIERLNCGSATA
jgi:hypothetical protein